MVIETSGLADPLPILRRLGEAPALTERFFIDGVIARGGGSGSGSAAKVIGATAARPTNAQQVTSQPVKYGSESNLNDPDAAVHTMTLFADDDDLERAARSLKVMSHPLRLRILGILGGRVVGVQDLVDEVGSSRNCIARHLAILRDHGILACRKDAGRVYYRVKDDSTRRLIGMIGAGFREDA